VITVQPTNDGMTAAAEAIRAGEVVAYPTETVYGLGVDPFSETAVERLFEVKGRVPDKPVLVIVADVEQLGQVTRRISRTAAAYIDAFWPGPLSLLFPRASILAPALTAGSDKVCARCPANTTARQLCRAVGHAITSSSANRSGAAPAQRLSDIELEGVAVGIDGGALGPGAPSTVLDPDCFEVHREGTISRRTLADFREQWQYNHRHSL